MLHRNSILSSNIKETRLRTRSKKQLPSLGKDKRESIVLLSRNKMKKFQVFLDEEVGILPKFKADLHETVNMRLCRMETRTTTAQRKSSMMESKGASNCWKKASLRVKSSQQKKKVKPRCPLLPPN